MLMNKFLLIIILLSTLYSNNKIKSVLLPGWGQSSMGEVSRGKLMITDALLLITTINGKALSKNYKSDYYAFASEHAGVNWSKTDYLFAVDIGYYENINEYNNIKARQRSLEMKTDLNGLLIREYGHAIYPDNGNFDWDWDSESNRRTYQNIRLASSNWDKYSNFAIAGLIVNRIISLIDILYLERTGKSLKATSQMISTHKGNFKFNLSISI